MSFVTSVPSNRLERFWRGRPIIRTDRPDWAFVLLQAIGYQSLSREF